MEIELFKIGFVSVHLVDVLDIVIVAFLLYRGYKLLRQNTALQTVAFMLFFLFVIWRVVDLLNMLLLKTLISEFIQVGAIALVVIFAPDLRRLFVNVSRSTLFDRIRRQISENLKRELDFDEVIAAVESMALTRTGALVVLIREDELADIIQTGDRLNAKVSRRLLESIFSKKSPLHDGAVVIKDNLIVAARCVLPVSDDPDIPPELGLRHRSALGVTEISDAGTIIVSEETGKVSYAKEGFLKRNVSPDELRQTLSNWYHVKI